MSVYDNLAQYYGLMPDTSWYPTGPGAGQTIPPIGMQAHPSQAQNLSFSAPQVNPLRAYSMGLLETQNGANDLPWQNVQAGPFGGFLADMWNNYMLDGPDSHLWIGDRPPPDPYQQDLVPNQRQWMSPDNFPGSQADVVPPNTWPEIPPADYDDHGMYADRTIPEYQGSTAVPGPRTIGGGPNDPYMEYGDPPAFGPEDDMMAAAIAKADQMAAAEQQVQQPQVDPFGDYIEDYNASTEEMIRAAEQAHKAGMFLGIGKSFLADPGNWGQSMAGSVDAINNYNYAKAGIPQMRAERDRELVDQSLIYSQIAKNQASMGPDEPSWQQQKDMRLMEMIASKLERNEITLEAAELGMQEILGAGAEVKATELGILAMDMFGQVYVNGQRRSPEEVATMAQTMKAMGGQISDHVKSQVEQIEHQNRVALLVKSGMDLDQAETVAELFAESTGMIAPGNTDATMDQRIGIVVSSVQQAREIIMQHFPNDPAMDEHLAQMPDEEILEKARLLVGN